MKKILLKLCAIVLVVLFSGCTQQSDNMNNTIIDRAGNTIVVPDNIDRVVSLSPAITQLIIEYDLKEKLISVDTQSNIIIGGLDDLILMDMMAPDIEMLLELDPDIILASEISFGQDENIFNVLKDNGISVAFIPASQSIADIKLDNSFIADILNISEKGEQLNREMDKQISIIREIGSEINNPRTVLFEISPSPDIYSFGSETFLNEMIELIGARNIFSQETGWLAVSQEIAISRNPDVILTNVNFIDDPVQEILQRNGWQNINAVLNEDVFYIDNTSSSLPNNRIIYALKQMAVAIYPDEFSQLIE